MTTTAPVSVTWIGGSVKRPKLNLPGSPFQLIPGEVLLVSTVPSFRVMLDESPSIVTKNCTYWPESRTPSPNFAAEPFPSSRRLYARWGVAMVPGPPVPSVSGLLEAATLTMYTSTRATWSYGNGASMRKALVVPALGVLVETPWFEHAAIEMPKIQEMALIRYRTCAWKTPYAR